MMVRCIRKIRDRDSNKCTGMRIVRACSAIERLMDCLIHQVA